MKLRDEFSEFLQIRFSRIKTILTFAVPAGVSIWFYQSGELDYVWLTIYGFVVYLLLYNSLHILFAREKLPDVELIVEKSARNRSVAKYRQLVPFGWGGLLLACGFIMVFGFLSPVNTPVNNVIYGTITHTPTITVTPTLTTTSTATITLTPTSTQTFTPTPKTQGVYYMIVVDASETMQESFDGQTKLDLAKEAVNAILENFEPGANYGLVVIGGEPSVSGADLCSEPSSLKVPFSARPIITNQISQLQPAGGGSISEAFVLAKNQFDGLDERTARVLIFITGSEDGCARDEWQDLQNYVKLEGDAGLKLHGEMIVLDSNKKLPVRRVSQFFSPFSKNIIAQYPPNLFAFRQAYAAAVENINTYVQQTIGSFPTLTPVPSNTPETPSPTLGPVTPSSTPTITLTPSITPTFGEPTLALTWTASVTPVTPSATALQQTSVQLLSVTYVSQGIGCQVDVQAQVIGSAATGQFHVRNASYAPGDSSVSTQTTLQVGTNYASSVSLQNLLTLSGNQPAYYQHEIWFEYNGIQSNHLTGLICPNIPPQ